MQFIIGLLVFYYIGIPLLAIAIKIALFSIEVLIALFRNTRGYREAP